MNAAHEHLEPAPAPASAGPAVSDAEAASLDSLLGEGAGQRAWWRRPATWIALVALALLVLAGVAWQRSRSAQAAPVYVTAPVSRGTLKVTVTATGTLQPTRTVNIGSELSGTVARVRVDVNDRVKAGQVMAELDTSKLQDQVLRSRAALASAEAARVQAQATLREATASLGRLEEVARLSGGKVPSKAELDTGRAAVERARAAEASAVAAINEARAALSTDSTNLRKASIRAPIDGVVLTRNVDPGNAVAASLQAVTLFTLAADLSQLELKVNVDEADVGRVREGQPATFSVAAWPERRYPATITRVAYGSTITDNVVTYATVLAVDNADLTLRPGMTGTATISAQERRDVLLVPNTALRFAPAPAEAGTRRSAAAASGGSSGSGGIVGQLLPRFPRGAGGGPRAGSEAGAERRVWVLQDGVPQPVAVVSGASDGRMTEVRGPGLREGMPVIVDQRKAARS